MPIKKTLAMLALFPVMATAAPSGYLDLYFVPSAKIEVESGGATAEDSGDGIAFKTLMAFDQGFFFNGEYQKNKYDDTALEFEQFRAGLGLYAPGQDLSPFGLLEYIRTDTSVVGGTQGESGYGAHVGIRGESGNMGVTLQAGYVDLGDQRGPEGLLEMDYQFTPRVGAVVGYRVSQRRATGSEALLSDLRVGLSLYFGK